jgi:hypothetical protein
VEKRRKGCKEVRVVQRQVWKGGGGETSLESIEREGEKNDLHVKEKGASRL